MKGRRRIMAVVAAAATLALPLLHAPVAARGGKSSPTPTAANGRIAFEALGMCLGASCVTSTTPWYDIWTVAPDGSDAVNLTKTPGVDAEPAWSPDGKTIVFTSNRTGDYDLYLMEADGSNVRRLTDALGSDGYPTWSPDGRRIAYGNASNRTSRIFVMRADGTQRRRIASFRPGVRAYGFEWSPDGRWLAFTKYREDADPRVVLMRPDGSDRHRVPTPGIAADVGSWSPDGKHLVLIGEKCKREYDCEYDIWITRRDGTGLRRVVDGGEWPFDPAWSPDGKHIVYVSERGDEHGGYADLWMVDVDGSNDHQFLAKPDTYDYGMDWQALP